MNLLARLTPTENVEFKLVKKLTSERASERASRKDSMINQNKKLKDMTKKLDNILDWLVDSPMDNKDYNNIHKIRNKYLEIEKNQQASEQKG